MTKIHLCKAYPIILFPGLFLLWVVFGLGPAFAAETVKDAFLSVLVRVVPFLMLQALLWIDPCIIEKEDRLIAVNPVQRKFRRDIIIFDDIEHIDYPYWREEGNDNTRSIRFVLKNGAEYLCWDSFFGLGALVKRWNKWNKGAAQEKESHYHATGAEFAVKPYYWATSNSYLLVMLCVVVCMCLWRIVSAPSTIFPYMALLSLLFMAYPVAMPLTTFVVANDELRSENFLARSNNHTIALAEVQWIRLSQNSMLVKKTDGDTANIHCFLSKMQVEQFKDQLEAMGITCILETINT